MENLDRAMEIVVTFPLPDDAEEQIAALAERSTGAERVCIESLFEAVFVARYGRDADE